MSPLDAAVIVGDEGVCARMIASGMRFDPSSQDGQRCMEFALETPNVRILNLLLHAGAYIDRPLERLCSIANDAIDGLHSSRDDAERL